MVYNLYDLNTFITTVFNTFLSSFFLSIQLYFWWLPYFLGIAPIAMLEEHVRQLANAPRILPRLQPDNLHLVPDTEHTILLPLTLVAVFWTYLSYLRLMTTGGRWRELGITMVLAVPLSLAALARNDAKNPDTGAIVVAVGVITTSLAVALARQSVLGTRRAAEKED